MTARRAGEALRPGKWHSGTRSGSISGSGILIRSKDGLFSGWFTAANAKPAGPDQNGEAAVRLDVQRAGEGVRVEDEDKGERVGNVKSSKKKRARGNHTVVLVRYIPNLPYCTKWCVIAQMKVPVQTLVPLYLHCTGAGNVGELAVYTDKEQLISSIAGGTATATLTPRVNGKIKRVVMSAIGAAAGSWELSKSATSQIATAAPDTSVIARIRLLTSGQTVAVFEFD